MCIEVNTVILKVMQSKIDNNIAKRKWVCFINLCVKVQSNTRRLAFEICFRPVS